MLLRSLFSIMNFFYNYNLDDVKFGERVDAPPSLTSAPRNAAKSVVSQFHSYGLENVLEGRQIF